MADYVLHLTIDDKDVEAKLDQIERALSNTMETAAQSGNSVTAAFDKLNRAYASINEQVRAGNLSGKDGIEIMRGMIAEEKIYIDSLKGVVLLNEEQTNAVKQYNQHQEELNRLQSQQVPQAKNFVQELQGAVLKIVAIYTSVRFVINAFKDVVKAAIESRVAVASMSAALKAQGRDVGVLLPQYRAMASRMQDIAGVSDEVALNVEKELVLRGMTFKQIESAMPLWANMVAAGMSVEESQKTIEQILSGQPSMLERTNAGLRQMRQNGASVEDIVAKLTRDYAGQAEEITKAKMGIEQMKERWGDVKEALGEINTGPLAAMIKLINNALIGVQKLLRASSNADFSQLTADQITGAKRYISALEDLRDRNSRIENSIFRRGNVSEGGDNRVTFVTKEELDKFQQIYGKIIDDYTTIDRLHGGYQLNVHKLLADLEQQQFLLNNINQLETENASIAGDQPAGGGGAPDTNTRLTLSQVVDFKLKIGSIDKDEAIATLREWLTKNAGEALKISEDLKLKTSGAAIEVPQESIDKLNEYEAIEKMLAELTGENASDWDHIVARQQTGTDNRWQTLNAMKKIVDADQQHLQSLMAQDSLTTGDVQTIDGILQRQQTYNDLLAETRAAMNGNSKALREQLTLLEAVGEQYASKIGGATGQLINNISQISDGLSGLNAAHLKEDTEAANAATMSMAAGIVGMLDTLSDVAYEIYTIGKETGDWGEAFETAILDTVKAIPVIGNWIASLIDDLWQTNTEKYQEFQKDVEQGKTDIQNMIAAGKPQADVEAAYQSQIDLMQTEVDNAAALGLTDEQILALEAEIAQTKKEQQEYEQKQYDTQLGILDASIAYNEQTGADTVQLEKDKLDLLEKELAAAAELGLTDEEILALKTQIAEQTNAIEDAAQAATKNDLNVLDKEKAYLEAKGEDTTGVINKQIADYEKLLETETDEATIWEYKTKIVELQNTLIENQNKLLEEQKAKISDIAALIDAQNIAQAQSIKVQYEAVGLTGVDLANQLNSLGINVGGRVSTDNRITTQINNYYGTGSTLSED